jgi:hypothetical protein
MQEIESSALLFEMIDLGKNVPNFPLFWQYGVFWQRHNRIVCLGKYKK